MAVDLEIPAQQVDIFASQYKKLTSNLQSGVIKPNGRNNARHLFVRFTGTKAQIGTWIKQQIAPKIVSTATQYDQSRLRETNLGLDGGLVVNFYLSADGYKKLGLDIERFADRAFKTGMKDQKGSKDALPSTWQAPYQGRVDAMVSFSDNSVTTANAAAQAMASTLAGVGTALVTEEGTVLRRPVGGGKSETIEHFGYFDGISNPIYTSRDLAADASATTSGPEWDPGAPLSLVLVTDPFASAADEAFGSFLVYRKLGQNNAAFEAGVAALAASLGSTAELAGAMIVGRFKDGTPVVEQNAPTPHLTASNHFNYDGDNDGFRCPVHSHIRKANPRGQTPLTSLSGERKRRITRRGIPYGKPLPNLVGSNVPSDPSLTAERGLLFLCFQRSIEKQFEFIQQTWVDNPNFPNVLDIFSKDGDDPLIGQDGDEGQKWPKVWGDKGAGKKRVNVESAVSLEGGEYFFAPSVAFIKAF